ncbi:MAG: DUF6088 family protein [Planctomycetota bacterium]
MARKGTLESKVSNRIQRSRASVFLRKDFNDIGGYDQIGRVLRQLVKSKALINLGYGTYARAKKSKFSQKMVPEKSLQELAKEVMQKLGIQTVPSTAEQAYNQGKSTQVPTGRVLGVQGRVVRKIGYDGKYITFEKVA